MNEMFLNLFINWKIFLNKFFQNLIQSVSINSMNDLNE